MTEFLSNFHFLRPAWLLALIPTLFLWWQLYRSRDPRLGLAGDIAPHLLEKLVTTPEDRPRIRPATLLLPLVLIAVIALTGPSFRRQPSPFAEDKSHLMLVVKMTPSMLTEDLQPSRLERVRTKIHDLLELRKGAANGLITYSGSAHLVMPTTPDMEVIEHMLEALDPKIMPTEGDVLASALDLAARQSKPETTAGSVLLVVDGVEETQLAAVRKWREQNPFTVQIMVPLLDDAALERSGIPTVADALGAKVQRITPDDKDIRSIAAGADQAIVATDSDESTRWRDDGYFFVPILVLGVLVWCRRGWSVSDD
jgi:Ca-activated chloride channel family protein